VGGRQQQATTGHNNPRLELSFIGNLTARLPRNGQEGIGRIAPIGLVLQKHVVALTRRQPLDERDLDFAKSWDLVWTSPFISRSPTARPNELQRIYLADEQETMKGHPFTQSSIIPVQPSDPLCN
jgi:hypothetical protein